MSQELRKRLDETARTLKRRKNWIIIQALEEYLQKKNRAALAVEARRQSLLVGGVSTADEEFWEKQADSSEWK